MVQPFVKIGDNNILWNGNHIGHHSNIRDNCFISSHVVISGNCTIGDNCFIGVNSTITNDVILQRDNFVQTGTMVSKNTIEDRIYCGFCDDDVISRVGHVDVNPDNPGEVVKVSEDPVLNIGKDGCFDENGVSPCSIISTGNKIYLYYFGFTGDRNGEYKILTGLAISTDRGESFTRIKEDPILPSIESEKLLDQDLAFYSMVSIKCGMLPVVT